jgi:hypothetical protein
MAYIQLSMSGRTRPPPGDWPAACVLVFDDSFPIHFAMSGTMATDAFGALIEGRYERLFKDWQVAIRKLM